jgi:glycosyltransferase involved in cell wall biosynthesis
MTEPRATLTLCTYNRSALVGRVLAACFEQTVGADAYEVVIVNDGSTDGTADVLNAAAAHAECTFTIISQPNAGLARARNAAIARARGQRIIFIDDDVLPMPNFVAEHLRAARRDPQIIVRGAAINTESFDELPAPNYGLANYSGNFFWTTNVSVGRARLLAVGAFDESFREYGWEDIELGLRLRFAGTRAVFNPRALAFHCKPRPRVRDIEKMISQARAQARTAVRLGELHKHWRVALATGNNPVQRALYRIGGGLGLSSRVRQLFAHCDPEMPLSARRLVTARALASEAYFEELERALRTARS